ncbi:MAG: hypothetical protein EOP11_01190 [Proteobacteria bacterium]|nr:MAG: hypothetical protein EOP11_01190 [Pseudomonadota bacterium]
MNALKLLSIGLICLSGLAFADPPGAKELHAHEEEGPSGQGFTLSPAALLSFGVQTQALKGPGPFSIPAEARLYSGEEVNLFRLREGRWERVDFETVKTEGSSLRIASRSLRSGDEIAVTGLGFLRVAEIAASGEAPAGHSH